MNGRFFYKKSSYIALEIATILGCRLIGDGNLRIVGVNTILSANAQEIAFLTNHKYIAYLKQSDAGACLLAAGNVGYAPPNMVLLVSENPYFSYAQLLEIFYDENISPERKISSKAYIHSSAVLGENCAIEDGVFIGSNVSIGDGATIMSGAYIGHDVVIGANVSIGSNSSLTYCIIGDNVVIYAGARIGQDGFGFAINNGEVKKVKQIGLVRIGDSVEVGANTCIDRGAIDDTIIGNGVKIDNLVQIGHNVYIGDNSLIAAQSGIAGSTKIGHSVMLGGQVGVAGHLHIGNNVQIAAQSGVICDIPDNSSFGGYPAVPINQWHRQNITLKKSVSQKNS